MTAPEVIALAIGLLASVMVLASQHGPARIPCDDCPGRDSCPCATGSTTTDPDQCTCGGLL